MDPSIAHTFIFKSFPYWFSVKNHLIFNHGIPQFFPRDFLFLNPLDLYP